MQQYDLIVIGAGPAGLMAAKIAIDSGMSVMVIDKGNEPAHRKDLVSGWFGRALFSMNTLNLEDVSIGNNKALRDAFKFIRKFGTDKIFKNKRRLVACRLSRDAAKSIATYLYDFISNKADILLGAEVTSLIKNGKFIVEIGKRQICSNRCLIATGRNSTEWLLDICTALKIPHICNKAKIGVRVEIPTFKINNILEDQYSILNISCEDICINSAVGEWEDSGIVSATGYNQTSKRTNFLIGMDSDVNKSIREIKIINVLTNDRVKQERIEDFVTGKSILNNIPSLKPLSSTIEELNHILPSFSHYSIMHLPEVKLSGILVVDENMKTKIKGLYGAGECTTKVSTLLEAFASGIIAGRNITKE